MSSPLQSLRNERLEEILGELFRKFEFPLIFFDNNEKVQFSFGLDGMEQGFPVECRLQSGVEELRIPLRHMGNTIGSLAVLTPEQEHNGIASILAYCVENSLKSESEIEDLSSEIVRVYEELSLLYSISNKMGSEMDVNTICQRVLEEADKILSPQNLSIMLLDSSKKRLYTRHSIGRNAESARSFTADISVGLIGHVLQLGEPVTVCDIRTDKRISLPYPVKSILCVPLVTDDQAMGLLLVCDKRSGDEFWSRELKLMGMFASEVASSIRKAQLYENNSKMFINTVEALASAIDAKDPYTYGHSKRVAQLSVTICEKLGMPKSNTKFVELAALLHDIGKIGTPESILNKPGQLRPDEFDKIKEHPAKGAEILSNIEEFSDIIKWIKHHHEWYDGKGYPDQIAAGHIPLEARIITIADAYDAMTSDRPYRKGMPSLEVIKIMEEFTRSQFDPEILKVFRHIVLNGSSFAYPTQMMVTRSLHEAASGLTVGITNPYRSMEDPESDFQPDSYPFNEGGATEFESGDAKGQIMKNGSASLSSADTEKKGFLSLPAFARKRKLLQGLIMATAIVLFSFTLAQYRDKAVINEHKNSVNTTSGSTNIQATVNRNPVKTQQPGNPVAHMIFDISPWGEIYVDGEKQGVSPPLKNLQVKTGEHTIVIRNKSLKPYRRIVTLNPQEQITIDHRFIAKQSPSAHKSTTKNYRRQTAITNKNINPSAFTANINP